INSISRFMSGACRIACLEAFLLLKLDMAGVGTRRTPMRFFNAAVFFISALLSVFSVAFAQGAPPPGAQPQPAQPSPGPTFSQYSYEEHGRYHPCPSSVRFNNRAACLGCPTPWDCRALPSDLTVH